MISSCHQSFAPSHLTSVVWSSDRSRVQGSQLSNHASLCSKIFRCCTRRCSLNSDPPSTTEGVGSGQTDILSTLHSHEFCPELMCHASGVICAMGVSHSVSGNGIRQTYSVVRIRLIYVLAGAGFPLQSVWESGTRDLCRGQEVGAHHVPGRLPHI